MVRSEKARVGTAGVVRRRLWFAAVGRNGEPDLAPALDRSAEVLGLLTSRLQQNTRSAGLYLMIHPAR